MAAQLPNAPFAFLATPPALKKRAQPLPSPPLAPLPARPTTRPVHRRRSSTFNAISNWAATVQPGSPAPCSPKRRPSVTSTRRPSITRLARRPSIGHGRAPSGSFINLIDTPSPASIKAFDLTQLGYTSVFVHLPKTPTTPSPYLRPRIPPPVPSASKPADVPLTASYAHIPIPPIPAAKPKPTMKRFRSLSILRPRSKSTSAPSSPTKSTTSTAKATKAQICAASSTTITKRKKAAYAVRPPPPLANELAIMQFSEGGSTETNIRRMMEAQARATGATGVADVYRDGKGGLWWDQDEELEYAPLLGGAGADEEDADEEMQWVSFADASSGSDKENSSPDVLAIAGLADVVRRGSVSSQDSDLDPAYMMHTEQVEEITNDVRKFGGGSVPGLSVLSLPSRPRRAAKHLRKPEFMIDMAAFGPRSPVKGKFSAGAASPTRGAMVKPKGKARRRPAPLKLAPVYTQHKRPTNSPVVGAANARKEFMDDSFAPAPLPVAPLAATPLLHARAPASTPLLQTRNMAAMKSVDSLALRGAKKPGRLMNLFGGRSKGD